MNTIVMSMGQGKTTSIEKDLKNYQIKVNNLHVTFAAKLPGVSVTLYNSGKIVFQGVKALELAKQFGYVSDIETLPSQIAQSVTMIGTDEVGNGSYFGGIAVVASFVTPEHHTLLKKLGVDDSKALTDIKIRQIAPILEKEIPHKALLLSPQKYNEVVGEGKKHNAVSVKVALHNQAIFLLLQTGLSPEMIVIDAFTSQKNYKKYLMNEVNQFSNPVCLEEKAEGKYLAVAVSSIIARKLFLENLDKLSDSFGVKIPSGAGPKADEVASFLLKKYGMESLQQSAKLHFKNTEKAITLASRKR
ncbi:ribonuclease HIII [Streptococcus fryi]